MLCIYCVKEKSSEEFTEEHILPQSLTKSVRCPIPFKTNRVCRYCNNKAGRTTDALYLRGYFHLNDAAIAAYRQIDFSDPKPVPLVYHGRVEGMTFLGNVDCEMWQGPAGCRIFHLHEYKIPEQYRVIAGGDPVERRKHPGTVYIFVSSDNRQWIQLTLASVKRAFPKSRRVPIGLIFGAEAAQEYGLQHPNSRDQDVIPALGSFGLDEQHKLRSSVLIDFDFRIMAKIALGVGCCLLGDEYAVSAMANELRAGMWAPQSGDHEVQRLRGTSYMSEQSDKRFAKMTGWPGGYTIAIMPVGTILGLTITLFQKKSISISITDEYGRFRARDIGTMGNISILIPMHQFWHGPISMESFIAHKTGGPKIPELVLAESFIKDPATYPPKRSAEVGTSA